MRKSRAPQRRVRPDHLRAPGSLPALLEELVGEADAGIGGPWSAGLHPGATVACFELLRELGRFGVVWESNDRELARKVAFRAVRAVGHAALK